MGSKALEQTLGWISELQSWGPQSVMLPVVDGLRGNDGDGGYEEDDCCCLGAMVACNNCGPGVA